MTIIWRQSIGISEGIWNTGFSPKALRALERHGWPGNVRELENRIQRAVIMAERRKITPADLELSLRYGGYEGSSLKEARQALDRAPDPVHAAGLTGRGSPGWRGMRAREVRYEHHSDRVGYFQKGSFGMLR